MLGARELSRIRKLIGFHEDDENGLTCGGFTAKGTNNQALMMAMIFHVYISLNTHIHTFRSILYNDYATQGEHYKLFAYIPGTNWMMQHLTVTYALNDNMIYWKDV